MLIFDWEQQILKKDLIFFAKYDIIAKHIDIMRFNALQDYFLEDKEMLETVLGIVLLVLAVFLIVAVLLQSGKDKKLSGAIAGGAETFFGQGTGSKMDKVLPGITAVVSIVFVILVIVMYIVV